MAEHINTSRFELHPQGDRLSMDVPWREAERIRDCLVAHGFAATVCLEPYDHASISLPRDTDVDGVTKALTEYAASQAA